MTAKEEMLLYEHIDWARRAMKKQMPLPIRKEARLEFCSMSYMYKLSCGMRKTSRWTIYSHGEDVTF